MERKWDETADRPGGYISKLIFQNGAEVAINENDIVIFVGPNNAGKSQSLKDIFELCKDKVPTTVISDVEIVKRKSPLESFLKTMAKPEYNSNYTSYMVMNKIFNIHGYTENDFLESKFYEGFRDLFVANLDTSARLTICNPPQTITRDAAKQHPIHYAAFDPKYRKWLSENFKKAFGESVTPNTQFGATIPLCIGEPVHLEGEYEDEQARMEAYARALESYPQVQNQGDGIRSFTGILLYLMLNYYCTYLIDEPESFLHPPQANIMGQIIGETLSGQQQAFLSTHSEEIIKGLLSVCPERIKIIRITRTGNTNAFSVLDNQRIAEVWTDPLLKYSNIMASLFHKSVVLCESDADCKMYSIVEDQLKHEAGKYAETLFIHCGGKHRMSRIITALKALNVDIKLIPDIDVLNDEQVFRGITDAFGIAWDQISKDYHIITSNLNSSKASVTRANVKAAAEQVLNGSSREELSRGEIEKLCQALKTTSKWADLKAGGISALPSGDTTAAYKRIDLILQEYGIFIVPAGELECFVKEVGGHGPDWTNKVLEKYPDLSNSVYENIRNFVAGIGL